MNEENNEGRSTRGMRGETKRDSINSDNASELARPGPRLVEDSDEEHYGDRDARDSAPHGCRLPRELYPPGLAHAHAEPTKGLMMRAEQKKTPGFVL